MLAPLSARAADFEFTERARTELPADQAASTDEPQQFDPCQQPAASGENWLDWAQRQLGTRVCATVHWFDGFFGDTRYDDEARKTHGRLSLGLNWSDAEGTDFTPRFRLRAQLPNLSHRINVFIGREEEGRIIEARKDASDAATTPVQGTEDAVGLGYAVLARVRQRLDFKLGVGGSFSHGLNPFAQTQFRLDPISTSTHLLRLTGTGFWRRIEGLGFTAGVDYDLALSSSDVLRWGNAATVRENLSGLDWGSTLTVYHHLRYGYALAAELSARGITSAAHTLDDYGLRLIYRRLVYRDWLIGEVYAGAHRPMIGTQRDTDPIAGVAVEMLFGARP